jgi:hypothetical protein
MQVIIDLERRLEVTEHRCRLEVARVQSELDKAQRRIAYLERDKARALQRAREAVDQGRYWQGVAIARRVA